MAENIEPILLTLENAAKTLGVCPNVVRALTAKGLIRTCRIGRERRYSRAALMEFAQGPGCVGDEAEQHVCAA